MIKREHYQNILDFGKVSKQFQFKFLSSQNIQQIANLRGDEIYQIIKNLSGSKIYEEKKNESKKILERVDEEKTRASNLLKNLQDKLRLLKNNKKKFEDFE